MKSAREVATDVLCEIDRGAMSHGALNEALRADKLQPSDKNLVKLLVSGCLEHLTEIDGIIDSYSKKKSSGLKPVVRNVLRISIFQIKYLGNIPQSAVCNEAVKIIDRRKIYGLKGFVNAVLRSFSETVPQADKRERPSKVKSEIPAYLKSIIVKRVGEENLSIVTEGFDREAPLTCRFNLSINSEKDILDSLNSQGISAVKSELAENGYELRGASSVSDIEAFKAGYIQIQGISSILACEAVSPTLGARVLDICAAPGGKTIALADMVGEKGLVVSRDLTDKKVKMIEKNKARCGFTNILTEAVDATQLRPEDREGFDCVMADLPCSGLGTIGHKQEIRYRVDEAKVKELAKLQKCILNNAVTYVKPGGFLLYSTCTISFEENEENFAYIRDELGLTPVSLFHKAFINHETAKSGYVQLLPGMDNVADGFFISLFKKEN